MNSIHHAAVFALASAGIFFLAGAVYWIVSTIRGDKD